MYELNDAQMAILDAIYFVEPFHVVVEESGLSPAVATAELAALIAHRLVRVLQYDDRVGDYAEAKVYDLDHIHRYSFLATKEGLLRHNGR